MKALLKKWAANTLFTSGPKSGSLSKIVPDALASDGIQPGTGQRISAEEMNYSLRVLTEMQGAQFAQGMGSFLQVDYPIPGDEWVPTLARDPDSGWLFGIVQTTTTAQRFARVHRGFRNNLGVTLSYSFPSNDSRMIAAQDVNGSGVSGVFAVGTDLANIYAAWHTKDSSGSAVGSIANTGRPVVCYDDVNGAIIGATNMNTGGAPVLFRIPDGATPTISDVTPGSLSADYTDAGTQTVAAGNGVALYVHASASPATTLEAFASTDGGATWSAATAPPITANEFDDPLGIWFEADFQGRGPMFVCAVTDSEATIKVYESAAGASWALIADIDHGKDYASVAVGDHVLVGGFLLSQYDSAQDGYGAVLVTDLSSGNMYRQDIAPTARTVCTDGSTVMILDDTNEAAYVSLPLRLPLAIGSVTFEP